MSAKFGRKLTRRDVYEEICGGLEITAINRKNPNLAMLSSEQIKKILDNLFGPEEEES